MAPQRAFVETTVLMNAVLKPHADEGRAARAALKRSDVAELPQYAIKEFKAGPLQNMAWFHNKIATVGSFQLAIDALHRLSMTPQRYKVATSLEALREAQRSIANTAAETRMVRIPRIDAYTCIADAGIHASMAATVA
jgi:hypothetical protein